MAHILFSIGIRDDEEVEELMQRMERRGYPTRDLSSCEAAQVCRRQHNEIITAWINHLGSAGNTAASRLRAGHRHATDVTLPQMHSFVAATNQLLNHCRCT